MVSRNNFPSILLLRGWKLAFPPLVSSSLEVSEYRGDILNAERKISDAKFHDSFIFSGILGLKHK